MHQQAGISPELVLRLERAGVSTAKFWLGLQRKLPTNYVKESFSLEKIPNEDWWLQGAYKIFKTPEKFFEKNQNIYHRGCAYKTVEQIAEALQKHASRYALPQIINSAGIPPGVIPHGRIGDGLRRDEKFYSTTKRVLEEISNAELLKNCLIIGYTGHSAPIAAACAVDGIPSSFLFPNIFNERNASALQDWLAEIIKCAPPEGSTNKAIMTEGRQR